MSVYALEALNLSKRFGNMLALDRVTLRLRVGSFHALLGENGAGKSTLVKCIIGYHTPDAGELLIAGRQQVITNPRQAHAWGIGMVYQHFALISNMTVLENLVLARQSLPAIIDWRTERQQIEARMALLPFRLPLNKSVSRLAAGERQKLEIIKQLLLDCRILILDEPTSVLAPHEADEMLGQLRALTRERTLSVIIITHKLREVMNYADEVTVLRKGCHVGSAAVSAVNPNQLASMIVDAACIPAAHPRLVPTATSAPVCLQLHALRVANDDGRAAAVKDISLSLCAGEIVGIAGVSGNGQRELVEALSGQRSPEAGEIRIHGELYRGRREQMRRHGFYCLPEEPLRNACVGEMSVAENLALRNFDRPPYSRWRTWLRRGAMVRAARGLIARYHIRTPSPHAPIATLSGGNVQRAVLARDLTEHVQILVIANPCFGLDLIATAAVRGRLMEARNRGAALLLVSEDLDEILELSDRLVVMSGGRLVHETTPSTADLTVVGRYMAGQA